MSDKSPEFASLFARFESLVEESLSRRARLGHVALLLGASAMSAVLIALLIGERGLPTRTVIAFGVMLLMALTWIGYAGWVLQRRWTLLPVHRVVASRIATAFSAIFTVGALAVAVGANKPALYIAAMTGAVGIGVAQWMSARSHSHVSRLRERRAVLERELGLAP